MSNTKTHQRVFALVTALLFLATAISGGAIVIWQIHENSKQAAATKGLTSSTPDQATNTTKSEATLEGTKLTDFTPVDKIDQLQAVDTKEGTGEVVKEGATVTVHYTGAVAATGVIFQSSHDGQNQPVSFGLSQVIQGWAQGMPGMKVGGTRRILIPASLAYGANPPSNSGIPANADLVFDVELLGIK
jgi:FKBP-type peptidyl-prolyl cis-trans isomerase